MKNKYYPHLASPIKINGVTFKNRIFGAPMSNPELDADCNMRKEEIAFHENRARGGLASVAIGLGIVDAIGRTHTKEIKLYDIMSLPSLKEAANAMHRHNCNAVMELAHGGKYGNARSHGNADGTLIGPNDEINPEGLQVRSMTDEDIYRVADCFAKGAKLVKEAGFDMVLIHGGHGWLLGQFSSPTMNHRTDKWGGSLENRMRFPLLVIEKVREAVGANYPIEFRMSGAEYTKDGYTIEEGIKMAKMLDGKVDIIHVSAGIHEDPEVFTLTHPSMFIEHGYNVYLASEIKKHVKTPVATLGGLNDPDMMEEIIASGKADIIQIARQSLADPYFPEKAFSGNADDINRCCRCYTCFFNYLTNRTFCCAFNPVIGNELENKHAFPVTTPKKVIVVGGGPGGMEAAITAADRGHSVTLYEKSSELGGQLLFEQYIPFKKDMFNFVNVLKRRLKKSGVEVCLNTELTAEQAAAENADVIITAIGAKPIVPPIPGIDNEKVVGLEVLHQKAPALGHKVVILGGGLVGCESAIYLDSLGKDVTIVEMKNDWAADSYFMHKNAMVRAMRGSNIKINVNTKAKAVTAEGLVCETTDGEVTFEADSILLTAGMKADRAVAESFYNAAPRVFETGDCIKPGRVVEAVTNGYYRALDI
ncbi:FAD-dependent oxidoreductase [Clostridium autoethanogenum]|uniref:FAD-dependent oxidoreductase n=1 Tax=Clostridium autoethanogenum DSM 10061 TaxID=1341692 RepID=A0ABM5NZ77_9CLOT|nr:FAD-dependent oxidoreductase [Clostridium autoethanogenum]AGY77914.1 FAD-dependent oxidoreductase [Clostridium autoethanogenum DSM 10061]ALU38047.1 Oxidoreductase [Clostridium autoethanogenum DSM 10061]OVY50811.1 NADH oxidase [Clostridium autoethanogenum]